MQTLVVDRSENIGRILWLGQQRTSSLIAVLKVLSRSAHGGPAEKSLPGNRGIGSAGVSNGTEKPVRKLAE
jgi:hypothetical protein